MSIDESPTSPEQMQVLGSVLRVREMAIAGPESPIQLQNPPPMEASESPIAPLRIKLWLVGEHIDLDAQCAALTETDQAPYWAFCWAGGQALSRFIWEDPSWVRGKHVVDFGAGSGVAGIAAAMAGAARVTAVDIASTARAFCEHNAKLNGIQLETAAELPEWCDVILAADVLYHLGNLSLLQTLQGRAQTVLVADPQRRGTPVVDREPVRRYAATTVPDVDYPIQQAAVYVF